MIFDEIEDVVASIFLRDVDGHERHGVVGQQTPAWREKTPKHANESNGKFDCGGGIIKLELL